MRRPFLALLGPLFLLSACADIQALGSVAIENRRVMNDMQARTTMHATCDISVGAYYRELNANERRLAALICGGEMQASDMGIAPLSSMAQIVVEAVRQNKIAQEQDYAARQLRARQERLALEAQRRFDAEASRARRESQPLRSGGALDGLK